MSRSNPVGQKHTVIFGTPALSAFPQLSDPNTPANGRTAQYRIASQSLNGGGGGFIPRVFTFENIFGSKAPGTNPSAANQAAPVTLSIEVSADGTTYVATNASPNNTAVTQVFLQPGARRAFDVLIPANTPYFRITAIGGGQIEMTIDNDAAIERLAPVGLT